MKRKILKILFIVVLAVILIPVSTLIFLYLSADMGEPFLTISPAEYVASYRGDTVVCRDSYLKRDSCGIWELYIQGSGQVRGAKQGVLTKDLMRFQEDVFVNQIKEIVPSDSYLSFLRGFIIIFNRNLGKHIPLEYRDEIEGMSQFCTHDYDAIGTPYERQLNYHGAHDIGHAMQQYMLVGCSSFGVWGAKSKTGSLVVGRNFDFYVGDDFAKNKLVTFAVPDSGYRYVSIGWAGMNGVLSGMNQCGITVTINAAKGAIPTSAAMPISILTREILQYASTIEEAYRIAQRRETFVSESILIGAARENKAVIIEKTPKTIAMYSPHGEQVICTNHFQSQEFADDSYNKENIQTSDSKYRYDRLAELLSQYPNTDYKDAIAILRNRYGSHNEDIGIGNEMTLNQSIAHHSVVFMPAEKRMWVTTEPWQSGRMVCYNLQGFFDGTAYPFRENGLDVTADTLFLQRDYPSLIHYRQGIKEIRTAIKKKQSLDKKRIDTFLAANPNHYYTYRILGDYYASLGATEKAKEMYLASLSRAIPYRSERNEIEKLLNTLGHD